MDLWKFQKPWILYCNIFYILTSMFNWFQYLIFLREINSFFFYCGHMKKVYLIQSFCNGVIIVILLNCVVIMWLWGLFGESHSQKKVFVFPYCLFGSPIDVTSALISFPIRLQSGFFQLLVVLQNIKTRSIYWRFFTDSAEYILTFVWEWNRK